MTVYSGIVFPKRIIRWLAAAIVFTLFTYPAHAFPPYFPSDEELLKQPVVVVGRWCEAAIQRHDHIENRDGIEVWCSQEARTEISIERVLKGNVKRGLQEILLVQIGWAENGGPVESLTPTCRCWGDATNVTDPNIWFLYPSKSWDKNDGKTYLTVYTFRGVQPLELESYFLALGSSNPTRELTKLLSSGNPLIESRARAYLSSDKNTNSAQLARWLSGINRRIVDIFSPLPDDR